MWSMITSMFGGSKVGEKLVDNISNGIDKLVYTKEEQSEDAAQARREGLQVYMKWLESTSGSRVARRFIAIIVVGIWALEHVAAVIMSQVAIFVDSPEKFIESSKMLAGFAESNNALVGVVLMFYFGGPVAADGIKSLVNKWVEKKEVKKL